MARGKIGGGGPMRVNLDKAQDFKGTLKRIFKYFDGQKRFFIIVVVFIILSVLFNILTSILLQPTIDNYVIPLLSNPENAEYKIGFIKMILLLVTSSILCATCTFVQSKTMLTIAQKTVKKMRKDLFEKIEKLPIKYFDTHKHGELMSRITNDIDNISIALNSSVNQVISGALTLIGTLTAMILISPMLALISVLALPIMMFIVSKIAKMNKKQFIKQQESLAEVNGYIEEYISGQKVIKAFNKETDVKNNFSEKNLKFQRDGFIAQAMAGIVMPLMGNISNITSGITAVVAGILCINNKITIGTIALYTKFSKEFSRPITEITNQFNVIQAGIAGAERVFQIIDETPEFPENVDKPHIGEIEGKVEFKDVHFGYEEKEEIIKGINISVNKGETIAIVGPTGVGKTTLINLLTRFYDVTSGEILIDGKNIKEVNKESLRECLGIVLQDTVLFNETVKENIRFGKLDATDEEIINAAKLADAHNFIKRLPQGYDTVLSEDAGNISKGQAQLINIARVILNNPQILILDEATSNVDTRMEVRIQEAINNLLVGRTSFVIAHRLSTIVNADRILVVNEGKIVEEGTHNELINKKGIYYKMYTGILEEAV